LQLFDADLDGGTERENGKEKIHIRNVYVDIVLVLNKGLFYSERPKTCKKQVLAAAVKPVLKQFL
jgi:hypothetical protein